MDDVLITFGALFQHFNVLHDNKDFAIKDVVLKSLEKRWAASDQDLFIASVLLNPFHPLQPFNQNITLFSVSSLRVLFNRIWQRFYKCNAPEDLWDTYMDYTKGYAASETLNATVTDLLIKSERQASDLFAIVSITNHPHIYTGSKPGSSRSL